MALAAFDMYCHTFSLDIHMAVSRIASVLEAA